MCRVFDLPLMLRILISPKKFPSLSTANSVTPSSATTASFPSLIMYISWPTSPFLQTYSPGLNTCKTESTRNLFSQTVLWPIKSVQTHISLKILSGCIINRFVVFLITVQTHACTAFIKLDFSLVSVATSQPTQPLALFHVLLLFF